MIPVVRSTEFGEGEWRTLLCLLQSPALWAFQLVSGHVGLDAAVEACRTLAIPAEASHWLARGGYSVADLPAYDDIVAALWAVRLRYRRKHRSKEESLQEAAEALGGTLRDAHAAFRVWERFVPKSLKSRVTP